MGGYGEAFLQANLPNLSYYNTPANTHTFHAQYHTRTGFLILLYRTAPYTRSHKYTIIDHLNTTPVYKHTHTNTHFIHFPPLHTGS